MKLQDKTEFHWSTEDKEFYDHHKFNIEGHPLVYTLPSSKLTATTMEAFYKSAADADYIVSIKRDGKNIRVIKQDTIVRMITSGGQDFYHNKLSDCFLSLPNGQYNMELIYKKGYLNDRFNTGYLATACDLFYKEKPEAGNWHGQDDIKFVVFDYIGSMTGKRRYNQAMPYECRMASIKGGMAEIADRGFDLITTTKSYKVNRREVGGAVFNERIKEVLSYDASKHEGLVLHRANASYIVPKSPYNFKIKNIKECRGVVVDVEPDKHGGNGTLIVTIYDEAFNHTLCRVSSGITNNIRQADPDSLLKQRVEIEYESISSKGEYILPRIKRFGYVIVADDD